MIVDFPVFFVSAFAVGGDNYCRLGYLADRENSLAPCTWRWNSWWYWCSEISKRSNVPVHACARSGRQALGFGSAVVALGVVVKLQSNVADTSVAPVTIAVRVTSCFTTSVPPAGLTWTTT